MREELERIQREQAALIRRGNGALALGWFSAHALSKTGGGPRIVISGGILPDQLRPIASATADAEKVFPYLDRAFREHHRGIIERAIELAQTDFEDEAS
ncbi:hypothetical protein [Sphingomonas rubra]|uniref:hypothetical protein n=1 Tax=Sphingomonas rubra TaxID=634430 RepID=UPI000B88EEB9|nr:hypothetical protein [Sphingomonas rubra]